MAKKNTPVEQKLAEAMPKEPDPFWPEGVAPGHLSTADQSNQQINALYMAKNDQWHCEKCGSTMRRSKDKPTMCCTCAAELAQGTALAQKINANWMEDAAALGISIFDRQPAETAEEWRIWDAYRMHYPMKLPTISELATECNVSTSLVVKTAQKWNFKVRMVEWARYTDAATQETRLKAIKEMNEKQLKMATDIQSKLATAIAHIEPECLAPKDIVSLFKVSTELERRINAYVPEQIDQQVTEKSGGKAALTKVEDVGEVISILQKAGVMPSSSTALGIEQTTTTRVIMKEDEGL